MASVRYTVDMNRHMKRYMSDGSLTYGNVNHMIVSEHDLLTIR